MTTPNGHGTATDAITTSAASESTVHQTTATSPVAVTGTSTNCSHTEECEQNYCRNGGTCTRIGPYCTPHCTCPPAFSGETCKDMVDSFVAEFSPNTKKRTVNVTLTSPNNFTFEDGYSQITEQLKSAPPEVAKLFDKRTSEMHVPTMESRNFSALFIARFTYVANITIITYLNDELVKQLQTNTIRRKRSTAEITISNVTDSEKFHSDACLLKNVSSAAAFCLPPVTS
ncbi:mucin-4-like [Eleutherodactylus coqui]|uniref:mucin-4-like n=1 Tax=Eleutherodactylus coqui TaxID=57060 RepID=UPI003461F503